jgi:flagellar biosynthesis protein FlhG
VVDESPGAARSARFVSIGGGKGGVGKSLVAANLSVALANAGNEVVLCDLDLGAANLHLMMGLMQAKPGIAALLSPEGTLDDAVTDTVVPGLRLLAGTGGTVASANVTFAQKLRIIRKLRSLKCDFVIIDVGAGVGYNALDFFELGQMRLLVATPQVTSMHDAYAFLKGAVLRTLRHHARTPTEIELLGPAMESKDREKVKDVLARIGDVDPAFGAKVRQIVAHFGAYLVGNQVEHKAQIGVFQSVARMAEEFLGIALPVLGCIPYSSRFADSVNQHQPFLAATPTGEDTAETQALNSIVDGLLAGDLAPEEELLVQLVEDGTLSETAHVPVDPSSPTIPASAVVPAPSQPQVIEVTDLPAPVAKPRVTVPRTRKRKPESEEKKRKRALDRMGLRRKITLPGMTPTRAKN